MTRLTSEAGPAGVARPGSAGEHELQRRLGTSSRARGFYDHQVLDHLNERMREFVARLDMVFVATADGAGNADCSFRAGPAGFVQPLDAHTLVYPEYRGNGVLASLGNITENAHVGLLFVDFEVEVVGLHVNGAARLVADHELLRRPGLPEAVVQQAAERGGRAAQCWVLVEVHEAYIHCSKHLPRMLRCAGETAWGSDDPVRKGGDHFRAKHAPRPWVPQQAVPPPRPSLEGGGSAR